MRNFSKAHLSDSALLQHAGNLLGEERGTLAQFLACLAEVDERQLHRPAGYPSLHAFCVHQWHLSEDEGYLRIRVARAARRFPAIFEAIAEGRLHLTAVYRLSPYLTPDNADELLRAASHQTRAEIERLLAERFPRPDLPVRVEALGAPLSTGQLGPDPVRSDGRAEPQLGPDLVQSAGSEERQLGPDPVAPAPRPKVAPLAPRRYGLQFTVDQETYDDLQRAQALLGVPASELPKLFGRAVKLLVRELEKRKFAATDRPRSSKAKPSRNPRHIPAHVKRAVWERDQARCTFVSETGHRCPAKSRLEFDHVEPVARGGAATAANVRLRCRAHNQYEAERAFGAGFMHEKREAVRAAKARHAAEEVIPWLRTLGFRAEESKRAAARCETMPEAPLEERIRVSLQGFGRRPQPCASSASHRPT